MINKKIIREALGVPENIVETAEQMYNELLHKMYKVRDKENLNYPVGDHKYTFKLKGNYRISDLDFNKIEFLLQTFQSDQVNEPTVASFAAPQESMKVNYGIENVGDFKSFEMRCLIAVPEDCSYDMIISLFTFDQSEILSNISHEMMHYYNNFKQKTQSGKQRARYNTYSDMKTNVAAMNIFLHNLYFTTAIENVVRPTEIIAQIKNNNIDQKEFINFLKNTETYKKLQEIKNSTFEKFVQELENDKKSIQKFFKMIKQPIPNEEELVSKFMEIMYISIGNNTIMTYQEILTTEVLEQIIGFQGEKLNVFANFVNEVQRFKNNPMNFYKYEFKKFQIVADKMLKKVSKLYGLLGKKDSIKEWNLHFEYHKPAKIHTKYYKKTKT